MKPSDLLFCVVNYPDTYGGFVVCITTEKTWLSLHCQDDDLYSQGFEVVQEMIEEKGIDLIEIVEGSFEVNQDESSADVISILEKVGLTYSQEFQDFMEVCDGFDEDEDDGFDEEGAFEDDEE